MTPDTVAGEEVRATPVSRGVLLRYRVMALTTATLLVILVFVGIPLQVAAGRPAVVNVVGTMHGFLYIVYLVTAFELTYRLKTPKWQMGLVLLAGTIPFCGFVAERKMTARYHAVGGAPATAPSERRSGDGLKTYAASVRRRWLSARAVLLHVEFAALASGCLAAGWWQATRALSGNQLSWVYSIEWPIFAVLAIAGWWQLIHEDPAAYRARKERVPAEDSAQAGRAANAAEVAAGAPPALVEGTASRIALALAALVGLELVLGFVALVSLAFDRPSGWLPGRGDAVYLVHAAVGLVVAAGAVVLVYRVRAMSRLYRIVAWIGFVGVALAGLGGLLTVGQSLVRFVGIALMLVGALIAGFGYLVPWLLRRQQQAVA